MSVAVPRPSRPPASIAAGALDATVRRSLASLPRRRGWLVRRMLVLADVFGLAAAFAVTEAVNVQRWTGDFDWLAECLFFVALLPVWVFLADVSGLYRRDEERTSHCTADDLVGVMQLVTFGTWIFFAGAELAHLASPSVAKLGLFWVLAIALVTTARGAARCVCRRSSLYRQNAIIVGAGAVGQQIAGKLLKHREYAVNVVGFVDTAPRERLPSLDGIPLLGTPDELRYLVGRFEADRLIIAFWNEPAEQVVELVRSLNDLDVQIDIVPRAYELLSPAAVNHTVEGIPLVGLPPLRLSRRARATKRVLDVVVSAVAVVLLMPLFALVALLIKLDSRGPVFFRQRRVGKGGEVFTILKLRTMQADAEQRKGDLAALNRHAAPGGDSRMFKVDDDPRVTRVGRFLRKYSLDELPQLLNVLTGEMSLVGPRPLIEAEACFVTAWAEKRLDLTPGITGLWQVLGRSSIPFGEMVQLDYLYVTTWSLWRDCLLLLRTLPVLAQGSHD